jgi:hypothetical protein
MKCCDSSTIQISCPVHRHDDGVATLPSRVTLHAGSRSLDERRRSRGRPTGRMHQNRMEFRVLAAEVSR